MLTLLFSLTVHIHTIGVRSKLVVSEKGAKSPKRAKKKKEIKILINTDTLCQMKTKKKIR
jgi:hypothetical protein